jgi:hypothetical protein
VKAAEAASRTKMTSRDKMSIVVSSSFCRGFSPTQPDTTTTYRWPGPQIFTAPDESAKSFGLLLSFTFLRRHLTVGICSVVGPLAVSAS